MAGPLAASLMPLLRNAPVVSPRKRQWLWWPSSLLQQLPGAGTEAFQSSPPGLAAPWAHPLLTDPLLDLGVLHPRPVPRVKPRGPAVTAQCEEVGNHGSALVTRAAPR